MSFSAADAPVSDLGIFVMLMLTFLVVAFVAHAMARRTILPAVRLFLRRRQQEMQQQLQQALYNHQRLRAIRLRAANQHFQDAMEERGRRHIAAIEAQELPAAARQLGGQEPRARREVVEDLFAQLEYQDRQ